MYRCTGVLCTGVLLTVYCLLCTGVLLTVYWCTLATTLRLCFSHTVLTPYYEANRFSATHNVLRILWNPNRYYRIRSSHHLLQSISPSERHLLIFRDYTSFYGEELLATRPTSSLGTTPCLLSATAYSIHSQLHSILEAIHPFSHGSLTEIWQILPSNSHSKASRNLRLIRPVVCLPTVRLERVSVTRD